MSSSMFRSALILGLLSAVGPLSIDMYLPALPAIEAGLRTDIASTQLTLTLYFLAFGVAQLVYGPLADQYGRKWPLYAGLAIFIAASIGCAFAPTIGWLITFRFLQGLGGAVVMVVPRAIIRDMHTGNQATRLMAMIMLVISVSPMLAPLFGSGLILLGGWRVIFGALALMAVFSLLLTGFVLPETLAESRRTPVNLRSMWRGTKVLFRDPVFMGLTFIAGFGMASFFVFIASATFVYTDQFGLSPTGFSIAFAINAIGFFSASQVAANLGERFGIQRVISWAVTGFMAFTLTLLALTLGGFGTLPVIVGFLFMANACLGLVIPTTMVMALDDHGDIAGLASSLGGTLQMLAGGIMITAAAPFFNGTATPMVAAIALCAVAAFILTRLLFAKMPARRDEASEI
ncbi:multidrug effflux MFS transporter [Euryhalocaulis caribicus]|uniref:multidrug effflux MFS transporter n=1 Tax=Euryhalocaulis caribicus TaxID=1161401 RepID=UPI000527492A|nr:multidrug effflux MFS transporter [Euryhalocaulis caribicus]